MTEPRVLLADADEPTRMGLRMALRSTGFDVVGEAGDAAETRDAVIASSPDLVVVSTDLPGGGMDVMAEIAASRPGVRLVLLTERPSGGELLAAVLAGASGYLSRDVSPDRLPAALKGILAGEVALPRRYSARLLDELRSRRTQRAAVSAHAETGITDREWEVLQLLAEDCTTAQMAQRLRISEVTVRRHVSKVVAKLGVADRAAAAELMRSRSTA
jgi:DNA-binding NarL/FixJ family response regulator